MRYVAVRSVAGPPTHAPTHPVQNDYRNPIVLPVAVIDMQLIFRGLSKVLVEKLASLWRWGGGGLSAWRASGRDSQQGAWLTEMLWR